MKTFLVALARLLGPTLLLCGCFHSSDDNPPPNLDPTSCNNGQVLQDGQCVTPITPPPIVCTGEREYLQGDRCVQVIKPPSSSGPLARSKQVAELQNAQTTNAEIRHARDGTDGRAHKMINAFAAYGRSFAGQTQNIAILGSAIAIETEDLVGQYSLAYPTFSSPELTGLTSRGLGLRFGADQPWLLTDGHALSYDPLFSFDLEPLRDADGNIIQDIYGPILQIRRDHRELGTTAAILALGQVNNPAGDATYSTFGIAPGARLISYPVENFYRQYCYWLRQIRTQADQNAADPCDGNDPLQHDEQAKRFRHVLYGQTIAEAVANSFLQIGDFYADAILSLYVTDELYQSAQQSQIQTNYQDFIAGLKQADLAEALRIPVVMPAGDHSLAHPALPGTLKLADTTIGDHVLVVTALNAQGNGLVGGANKCGDAAAFCLAAPGENLLTILLNTLDQPDGPSYRDHPTAVNSRRVSGSLYAASVAAGALALVQQAFSATMSGTDIVKRLLDTADKTGIFADSSTYGQGVIDLNAATTPIGGTSIPLTADARGASLPLGRTGLALDSALFGDAFTRAFAGHSSDWPGRVVLTLCLPPGQPGAATRPPVPIEPPDPQPCQAHPTARWQHTDQPSGGRWRR